MSADLRMLKHIDNDLLVRRYDDYGMKGESR